MTFRENLNRICKEKGTNLTTVMRALGISTSKVTAINTGSLPSEKMLVSIANYLGCSVKDFFADEDEDEAHEQNLELDEDEKDIINVYRGLSRQEKHMFMAMVYKYDKE